MPQHDGTTTAPKFEITLADLRRAGVDVWTYNSLVRAIQGREFSNGDSGRTSYIRLRHDAPIALTTILESNGLHDALWTLRCVPNVARDARLFAVWCARQVGHRMIDQRSKDAVKVAERFANGEATEEELIAARDAARDAVLATAWAGTEATDAAESACWAADGDATKAADRAAGAAAEVAYWATARAARSQMFIRMCEGTAPWQQTRAHNSTETILAK